MGIKNSPGKGIYSKPQNQNNELNTDQILNIIKDLGNVVNKQGDALKRMSNNQSELYFKIGKMDEQIQLFRLNIRMNRDRLNMFFKTLAELGIIDPSMFDIANNIVEGKNLPITSEGKINAVTVLTRYNSFPDMPIPQNAERL